MQQLGPNQEKWLAALEGGAYRQGRSRLNWDNEFCCLGVGCEVFGLSKTELDACGVFGYGAEKGRNVAPKELVEALALHNSSGYWGGSADEDTVELTALNDRGATFADIARIIRANPDHFFSEAR